MLKLIRFIKPFAPFIALAVAFLFLQAFSDLSLPNLMSQLVNMILGVNSGQNAVETMGQPQDSSILKLGLQMLVITLVGGGAAVSVSFLSTRIAAGIGRDLRYAVFRKVESFSSREFDDFSTASLITRCTNDINQVQGVFIMGIRMICYAPIMGIGGIIMAIHKAPSMSWIIALAVIVLMCQIALLTSIVLPKFKIIQGLVDKLNKVARETLNGLMVIRAFGAQDHEKKKFETVNDDLTKTNLFVNRVMSLQMPLMQLLMNAAILLIIWTGAHRIEAGAMGVGDMMAFIQYTMQIIFSFLFFSMMFVMLPRAAVSAGRIAEVIENDISIKDPEGLVSYISGSGTSQSQGRIEFKNVSFRYEGAAEDALKEISFTAEQGQTTAIIGATGSGKSTIANLIMRFYDVNSGSITLNGVDVRNMSQEYLRSRIGYVPQKSILLSGSIDFNLRYGKKNASDNEIREGAEIAQVLDFIEEKPEAMEALLAQGGANISGGQKQRLSIARALVRNPDILIFDDSFSALDFATDARLREALGEKRKDTAKIIVAQRVGTIMQAEKIIVLEEGIIVGMGKHEELMQNCAEYREIAESQIQQPAESPEAPV
jgi:ATP-binding cassette subfamily B protein